MWCVLLLAMVGFSSVGLGLAFGGLLVQSMKAPSQEAADPWTADDLKKAGLTDAQIAKMKEVGEGVKARVGKSGGAAEAWWALLGLLLSIAAAVGGALAGAGPTLVFRRARVQ